MVKKRVIPQRGKLVIAGLVGMHAVGKVGGRQGAVGIYIAHRLPGRDFIGYDSRNGRIVGDSPRVLVSVFEWRERSDDHMRVRRRAGDLVDQRAQPRRRRTQLVLLKHVVGADQQQHNIGL